MNDEKNNAEPYWLETEASEVARTFFGNPYMIASLGRTLPESIPMEKVHTVLDIGCGNGEWACRLAQENPHVHVIGIDTSHSLIYKAVNHALMQRLNSVSFFQFDAAQSLAFHDQSYDLVHVHSLAAFIATGRWEKILEEMLRVLKARGWLNIVDYEQGSTSSQAFNKLHLVGMRGVRALGGSIAPASHTYGVAARLYGFLVDAGMIDVTYSVHSVDYGVNSRPDTPQFLHDLVRDMKAFKPYVMLLGLIESDAFDTLIAQANEELHQSTSCGYGYLISAVGCKDL